MVNCLGPGRAVRSGAGERAACGLESPAPELPSHLLCILQRCLLMATSLGQLVMK